MPDQPPVTLITGSRKGIGLALTKHYIDLGHTVIGFSRSDSDFQHDRYAHYCLDVADEAAVINAIRDIKKKQKRIDNLLNNAGIASMNHTLLTPVSTLRRVMDTNVCGSFIFAREAAKQMQKQQYGRIVNFTSVAVPLQLEGEAIYAASKAALETLTEIQARELAPMGITVNAVGPTPIETDLLRGVDDDKLNALLKRQAIHRYGEMRDVINVIDFFISPSSDFVTGQVLYLGGLR